MNDHRVLIANHDAVAANRWGALLRGNGYVVDVASTSDEAIYTAVKERPSLLIVNPVMPGLSGFEAAAHIARRGGCSVLFLTHLANDVDFAQILGKLVKDGIRCAALPEQVSNSDLVKFVHSELGPAIATKSTEPKSSPAFQGDGDTVEEGEIDLSAGFVPIENTTARPSNIPPGSLPPDFDDWDEADEDDIGFQAQDDPYAPLFDIANSGLYRTNAFRITGLQVTATTRDIRRAYQEFSRSKELGRSWVPPFFIPDSIEPSDDERETAFTQIDNPEQRLLHEFFWFWPEGDEDEAFHAVQAKDLNRAVGEWRRLGAGSDSAGIASHNLAVFNHLMALKTDASKTLIAPSVAMDFWRDTYHYWCRAIENGRFWDCFIDKIKRANDPRATPALAARIWASLPEAILYINAANAVRIAEAGGFAEAVRQRHLMYVSGLGKENADKAMSRALAPLLQHLTLLCSQATTHTSSDPGRGIDLVRSLNDAKAPILKTLNCLVGSEDPRRIAAHDEVATAMRSCLIDYVNQTKNWTAALPLFENCLALSQQPKLQKTLSEDIATLQENIGLERPSPPPPPGASAAAKPTSGDVHNGSTQRPASTSRSLRFAIGRMWQAISFFDKGIVVLAALVTVSALLMISGTSGSETRSATPPTSDSSQSVPQPAPAYDTSPAHFTPPPHLEEDAVSSNENNRAPATNEEIERAKVKLKSMDDQMQALNVEMSEYTSSIDADKNALDRMKAENDAGGEVDHEQYDQTRTRYNDNIVRYNADAERHNALLRKYHVLLAETNGNIDKYNHMVKSQ